MTTVMRSRSSIVAGRVRAFMAEQQHTQTELAAVLGIAQPNASMRYRGKRPYSIDELDTIARWLHVRIEDLFSSEGPGGVERRITTGWRSRLRCVRRANTPQTLDHRPSLWAA